MTLRTDTPTSLVLLEPYNPFWRTCIVTGSVTVSEIPALAYGYGNVWSVVATQGAQMQIYFWPNKLILPSLVISIAAAIIAGGVCVAGFLRRRSSV